jgi:hypothetical protein
MTAISTVATRRGQIRLPFPALKRRAKLRSPLRGCKRTAFCFLSNQAMADEQTNENEVDSGDYPTWLGQSLLEDDLPWEAASIYSVREFLDRYTLHDSNWVTIHYDVAYEAQATLVIMWDSFWLPDEIAQSTSVVRDWPLLLIKLERVRQLATLGYEDINGMPRGISTAEVEEVEDKFVFVIHDHYGGSVEIVFNGIAHFLVLNRAKLPLKI